MGARKGLFYGQENLICSTSFQETLSVATKLILRVLGIINSTIEFADSLLMSYNKSTY